MQYIAFLRGINSGKNPSTKMYVLKRVFEDMGCTDVKTVIASGNVIFNPPAGETDTKKLTEKIERTLSDTIGFHSDTFVRTAKELKTLIRTKPFRDIRLTTSTRRYTTFVRGESNMKLPINKKGLTLLSKEHGIICSIVDLARASSLDLMKVLDRYWPENTTRGWKTIERIAKKLN